VSQYSIGAERYRLFSTPAASAPTQASGLTALPTPSAGYAAEGKPWSPHSPMFAFGVLAALTFGLMAVSTSGAASVRFGKVTAAVGGGGGIGKVGK
jgi:hypothetical protein